MMAQKPLMLKDFLELDSNSESQLRPPDAASMRCLLEAELGMINGSGRLLRSRSKKAMTKLSAVVNTLRLLTFSSISSSAKPQTDLLPRSLSKKFSKSLWKKRGGEEEEMKKIRPKEVRVRDIVRQGSFIERSSFEYPSLVVSSCSSCSDTDSCSYSDFVRSAAGSSECSESKKDSPPRTPNHNSKARNGVGVGTTLGTATSHPVAKEVENEGLECPGCQSEEEKEQLSPVSVMDFLYQEEEEEEEEEEEAAAISASFHPSLTSFERTTHQLLQKIRRFESLAQLDPVDLEQSFASAEELLESSDHVGPTNTDIAVATEEEEELDRRACEFLKQLNVNSLEQPIKSLLLDFFVEELSCNESSKQSSLRWSGCMGEEHLLLNAARNWMNGTCSWAEEDNNGEMCLKEMERNGPWRCFEEEEKEEALGVEAGVLGSLLDELVLDLLSS